MPKIMASTPKSTGRLRKTKLAIHSLPLLPVSGRVNNATNIVGTIVTIMLGITSTAQMMLATPGPDPHCL